MGDRIVEYKSKTRRWKGVKSFDPMLVPLADLSENEANPRRHSSVDLQFTAASLAAEGQLIPLVGQAGTGRLADGNGRLGGFAKLGWTHAAAILLPVKDVELQRIAHRLNKTAEMAGWDFDQVAKDLKAFADIDEDITNLGWTEYELNSLLGEFDGGTHYDAFTDVTDAEPGEVAGGCRMLLAFEEFDEMALVFRALTGKDLPPYEGGQRTTRTDGASVVARLRAGEIKCPS